MTHYPRATIQAALDIVTPLLRDHCEVLTPAGSFRRGLPQSRDLDLVAVPSQIQQQGNMFGGGGAASRSPLTDYLAALQDSRYIEFGPPTGDEDTGKLGDRMARFWLSHDTVGDAGRGLTHVPIDLYIALPPATYAVILAIRTGSVAWNAAMMAWLKQTPWSIKDGALQYRERHLNNQPQSEAKLYEWIGLAYARPDQRETMRDFQKVRP